MVEQARYIVLGVQHVELVLVQVRAPGVRHARQQHHDQQVQAHQVEEGVQARALAARGCVRVCVCGWVCG